MQGNWQTSDPLGYPDGWNNFAYVNNKVSTYIDWMGGLQKTATLSFNPSQAWVGSVTPPNGTTYTAEGNPLFSATARYTVVETDTDVSLTFLGWDTGSSVSVGFSVNPYDG